MPEEQYIPEENWLHDRFTSLLHHLSLGRNITGWSEALGPRAVHTGTTGTQSYYFVVVGFLT